MFRCIATLVLMLSLAPLTCGADEAGVPAGPKARLARLIHAAQTYDRFGDPRAALATLDAALKIDPQNTDALSLRKIVSGYRGMPADAMPWLIKAIASANESKHAGVDDCCGDEFYLPAVRAMVRAGDTAGANATALRLERMPGDFRGRLAVIEEQALMGDVAGAEKAAAMLQIEGRPINIPERLRAYIAMAQADRGDFDEAWGMARTMTPAFVGGGDRSIFFASHRNFTTRYIGTAQARAGHADAAGRMARELDADAGTLAAIAAVLTETGEPSARNEPENAEQKLSAGLKAWAVETCSLLEARGQKSEAPLDRSACFAEVAKIRHRLGDDAAADRFFALAVAEAAKTDTENRDAAYWLLAQFEGDAGRFAASKASIKNITDATQRDWAVSNLAAAQATAGLPNDALETFKTIGKDHHRFFNGSEIVDAFVKSGDIAGVIAAAREVSRSDYELTKLIGLAEAETFGNGPAKIEAWINKSDDEVINAYLYLGIAKGVLDRCGRREQDPLD